MPNLEHLEILSRGVPAWNEWRRQNRHIHHPELSITAFSKANLSERTAMLVVNLSKPDLREADLNGANLSGSNLSGLNLSKADLSGADLNGADLSEADLSGSNLRGANLTRANLSGADLSASKVGFTTFADIDLSTVKGIATFEHRGPSTVGIDTIYRSQGKIPEIFLRGAGVPEVFITTTRSLIAAVAPIEFYSCFISYSSQDQGFAERLYADMQAKGVRCWYAAEDLKIGDKFRQRIDDAIRLHDKLLVVLSETSVASAWVEKEVETAFEKERGSEDKIVLFPIRLDEAVMKTGQAWAADIRRTRHIGDFTRWREHNSYKKAFERLLRDLQGEKSEPVLSS